ncbi:hypothetical protein E8E11_007711 [Didymella keratinophila]|nr:hypothetical protein E8E11_007711 [Didymella keratinophila]
MKNQDLKAIGPKNLKLVNMHFTYSLLLFSPVFALTIPKGQTDGIYQISCIDDREDHELLSASNPATVTSLLPSSAKFTKRDKYNYGGCGNYALHHGDTDAADAALDTQCGSGA